MSLLDLRVFNEQQKANMQSLFNNLDILSCRQSLFQAIAVVNITFINLLTNNQDSGKISA